MVIIDKRLELLEAIVIAVKITSDNCLSEELDFVEYYDIPYVRELVNQIHIEKYPELYEYINDMKDCGYYTNLFLFFDERFNFNPDFDLDLFENKDVLDFAKIVKQIYEHEQIEKIFIKYEDYLNNLIEKFKSKYKINFEESLSEMYGKISDINFSIVISLLINGGFYSHDENNVSYVKGIKVKDNNDDIVFSEYVIVCLFHEYSHYFVNEIIDKYFSKMNNLEILYYESLTNGLPNTYHDEKTLLYEYFVRANSLLLSEKYISKTEYIEVIDWYKEIGFIRIEEIIELIRYGLEQDQKFEDIFKNLIINYFINLNVKKNK